MIIIDINPSRDINTITLVGEIHAQDILNSLEDLANLSMPKRLNLIYDLRNARLNVKPSEIKNISEISESLFHESEYTRTAILVTETRQTAFSVLFAEMVYSDNSERKVFSTYDAAVEWLKS